MIEKVGLYRCKNGTKTQWRVRWYGQYTPGNAKQKRYSRTFDRKKDAEQLQKAKAAELNKGAQRDPSTETLQEYADWWLKYRAPSQGLRPGTIELYEYAIDRLYCYFGQRTLLRKITPQTAEMFLAELKPLRGEKPLSAWTRHRILRNCKTLFSDAADRGFIPCNPFKKLKGPKTTVTPWYYVDPGEYAKLLRVTPTVREKAFYALCYTGGLRLTEALALRWSDIDFAKESVKILERDGTETLPPFHIKDHEIREIPLPKQTIGLLLQLQDDAPENVPYVLLTEKRYRRVLDKWQQCRESGEPWLNRYFANSRLTRFNSRVQRADIKPGSETLTIHTLRKCCCQNWVDGGLPINVVSDLMGHSDMATTKKYYSTVTDEHMAMAKRNADRLLAGEDTTDLLLTFSPKSHCKEGNRQRQGA